MTLSTIEWNCVPIREITSRLDPALPRLLDIYQKSFPVVEQVLVSFFLEKLEMKEAGEAKQYSLDVLALGCDVAGFAFYEIGQEITGLGRGGYLWFIAAHPDLRGGGIGKRMYEHVQQQMFSKYGCRALFFEIEESTDALKREGQGAADYADWRKAWYKRRGAFELLGTRYMCGVDWQPAILMQVMVHPNGYITPEDAIRLAHDVQDDSIEVVGELLLA
jgi:ribosomal protein S18 acetylase RimI-like enzyme